MKTLHKVQKGEGRHPGPTGCVGKRSRCCDDTLSRLSSNLDGDSLDLG